QFFVHSGSPWPVSPPCAGACASPGAHATGTFRSCLPPPAAPIPVLRPARPSRRSGPGPQAKERPPSRRPASASGGLAFDALFDRAEDAAAVAIEHLDPDPVAERQERGDRLAPLQRFHGPALGQAGGAGGGVLVGDGTRTD